MARELEIPVVIGSQLSRNVERREDKRPILSDLAESGSIEAEADLVCMLYRDSYYQRKKDAEEVEEGAKAKASDDRESFRDEIDIAELIIAKHRNGPVGTVKLGFKQDSRIFENISSTRDAEIYG
jgi:replicative DNA helicase